MQKTKDKDTASTVADLEMAIAIATDAHAGQVDTTGQPHILHSLRIMLALKTMDERIVAVLRDVVEQTNVNCSDLYWTHGFSRTVVTAVAALTQDEGESYQDFILRLSDNAIARSVMLAVIRDHLDPSRAALNDVTSTARAEKYRLALITLDDADLARKP